MIPGSPPTTTRVDYQQYHAPWSVRPSHSTELHKEGGREGGRVGPKGHLRNPKFMLAVVQNFFCGSAEARPATHTTRKAYIHRYISVYPFTGLIHLTFRCTVYRPIYGSYCVPTRELLLLQHRCSYVAAVRQCGLLALQAMPHRQTEPTPMTGLITDFSYPKYF